MSTGDALLAEAAERIGPDEPDPDRLADLAGWLRAAAPRLGEPAAATRPRTVLATSAGGPLLALARFPAHRPTDVHGHHSWGVGLVLSGRERYERWEPDADGSARLAEVRELGPGDTLAFAGPPDDVHRQEALDADAVELLLLGRDPRLLPRAGYAPAGSLVDTIVGCLRRGDRVGLVARYRPDALLDVNVPQWRWQLQGRDAIAEALADELDLPGRRVTRLHAVPTADGVLVETEARLARDGEQSLWRAQHRFRTAGDEIVEHVVYCTGHWDSATIARQALEAPMVRP